MSLISVSLEVVPALLPSRIFFLPERAGWIIWSIVRIAFNQKPVGEAKGDVVDDLGLLEGEEGLVVAARG